MIEDIFIYSVSFLIVFFAYRLYLQYSNYFYYKKQGIQAPKGMLPILGHLYELSKIHFKNPKAKINPLLKYICFDDPHFYENKILQVYLNCTPTIFIRDPDLMNEIFVSKNQFIDRSELLYDLMGKILGNGIVTQKTNEDW